MSSSFIQDLWPVLGIYSDYISHSFSNGACVSDDEGGRCQDNANALILKIVAIATILVAGVCGVALPLVGKKWKFLRTDSNLFVVVKAFAAGVILATGFVHMLPEATSALTSSCLPKFPWSMFPFSGFIAMMSALATLLADFVGTQYYEKKQEKRSKPVQVDSESDSGIICAERAYRSEKVYGEEEGGAMHIVGMRAHAAHHGHRHSQEVGACEGKKGEYLECHSNSRGMCIGDEEGGMRHIVVSQVLELGIVSHSVIIGLSLGVSHSPCTIRPLIGALSFHQLFEGFALGGCISQAKLKTLHTIAMACFFALTTPIGISIGIGVSSIYNARSPGALVVEGIFDSISAGILVYMALVDLIAADFLSKRMSCNARLQVGSYFALFLGASLMASLAIWS